MIVGASGSGKSSLALQLMAFGAHLVSDDLTRLSLRDGHLLMQSPVSDPRRLGIEARGLGLLAADPVPEAALTAIVDMDQTEPERLPEPRSIMVGPQSVSLIRRVENPAFAAMLWQFQKAGWLADT